MKLELPDMFVEALADAVATRVATRLAGLLEQGPPWMSTEEAIEYSRLPAGTFRSRAASGEIPSHGGRTRIFRREEVDAALGYAGGHGSATPLRRSRSAA